MSKPQRVFNYQESPVRTISKDGEPWFVAKDACTILELEDVSKAVRRLDEDEKGTNSILTPGGPQEMLCVNEPGLYSLILTSRKPEAKAFKRWITHEVLPAIRKTGTYTSRRNSFPWMDSLGVTLRQETKLSKELSKPEKLRLRARLLRQTQEETGHDYTDIISILVNSADNQEQKIIQSETKAVEAEVRTQARKESSTMGGQAKQALAWVREEYAKRGEKLAIIHEDWLLVRYDMWKMWAGRNKFNLTLVLRELHRQGVVEITSEGARQRYATKKRFEGKLFSVVWVKREAVEKATNVIQFSELTTR